ncbi:MAG: hypothetical protein M1815_003873 [Lichina confinis]|nr:MAG: hypothetical protein M1815_003873 [Lichina confinis]
MDGVDVVMEDLTPDDLLAIPDPEAAKYASQDRVRRSIRPSRPPQFYGTPSMGSGSRIGKKRTPPKRQAQEKLEAALAMAPMVNATTSSGAISAPTNFITANRVPAQPTTSAGPHEQLPGANQEGFSQDLGPDAFGDADADAAAVSDPAPYASQSALSSDYANAPTATVQPIVVPIMLQRNDAVPAPPVVPDIENLETITTEVADWFWPHVVSGEFCDIVEQAKKAGRIHAGYASTVVRRVGDVLLVPQKCDQ